VRAKALGKVAHTKVTRFIGLTGTPAPNGIKDIWGQIWFVDAGYRLGKTYSSFSARWFTQSYDGFGIIPHKHAQAEIEGLISDVCISLDPKDYFDIKDPIVINVELTLPAGAMAQYKAMEDEMFAEFDGQEVRLFGGEVAAECGLVGRGIETFEQCHGVSLRGTGYGVRARYPIKAKCLTASEWEARSASEARLICWIRGLTCVSPTFLSHPTSSNQSSCSSSK
jgi:hypothetical protein